MKIDKDNIEELIFDYHEGNLSSTQKNHVLDYIHQHPDCEALFAQWALSYGHVIPKNKDYGLTDRLLKPQRAVWYKNIWIYEGATFLILALLWWHNASKPSLPTYVQLKKLPLKQATINQPEPLKIETRPHSVRKFKRKNKGQPDAPQQASVLDTMLGNQPTTLIIKERTTVSLTKLDTNYTYSIKVETDTLHQEPPKNHKSQKHP